MKIELNFKIHKENKSKISKEAIKKRKERRK
jgi:hypothetical protein